ncbi:MAG: division/cell wall cluster transcriptional repressor MraZ [Ferruginibacter sp.]
MIGFLGEYEVTMDAKGRFLLPAGFRKQLADDAAGQFVINRGIETCLTLYPMQSWEPIFSEVSKLNDFDPKVRQFRRYFLNGATHLELDTAGRLLIPKSLMEYAGLEKDVVLVAAVDKIEIWDKNKYTKFFESFSPESYSELANQVMNKNEVKPNS